MAKTAKNKTTVDNTINDTYRYILHNDDGKTVFIKVSYGETNIEDCMKRYIGTEIIA